MSKLFQGGAAAIFALTLALSGSRPLAAQAELVTDRPDQTESAETVDPGHVQVEMGWLRVEDKQDGIRSETEEAPGTLVRVGLVPDLELRLGWSGWISQSVDIRTRRVSADGAGDAELGLKWVLAREKPGRPQVALLAASSVPVGENGFSSERYDPSVRLLLAHTLSERASLGYNAGVEWASEPAPGGGFERTSTAIYTAALGLSLSEKLGLFVELFGELPGQAGARDAHSFDAGLTLLATERLQLDLAAGVGLNDAAPDSFLGLGFSWRYPR